jgi:hypothetical protein
LARLCGGKRVESVSTLYGQNSGIFGGVSHGGVGMRLNYFNAYVQFGRGGEVKTLQELGLLEALLAGPADRDG